MVWKAVSSFKSIQVTSIDKIDGDHDFIPLYKLKTKEYNKGISSKERVDMPFIRVSYMENQFEARQLERISQTIMNELVQHFNVPADDFFQVFHSHRPQEFYYSRTYLDVERSDGLLYIQITLKSGRTVKQKTSFYEALAEHLSKAIPMRKEDVFIVLVDTEYEDWSFGNGIAQMLRSM
jgi:phenylpyruvate tautomerase PptA (4-oxalocrotonate tautomerase family)